MDRASANVKAERLNHARELLQRFDHLPDAVAQMARDRGVSPRQAYRYLQQARRLKQPVPIGDTKVAFTVKLSQELVRRVRLFANTTGLSLSEIVSRALLAVPEKRTWLSAPVMRCLEFADLFEIGWSHLGNPGVVVGSEARFLLQGMNLALHLRHLVVRKLWDHFNLLPNRVHGTRDLLFCTAGSSASVSIVALHAIHHALGHFLAVHQRHTDVPLSGDDVSDPEYAVHSGIPRHILASECVVFPIHVDPRKFLRHRADRRNDQRRAEFLFRAGDRFSLAALDFRFSHSQTREPSILHDDPGRQPAILEAKQVFVARYAQHFLTNHFCFGELLGRRVVRWLRQRHVLFAAAINQEATLHAQLFRLDAVRFAYLRNTFFQLMHAGLNAASP